MKFLPIPVQEVAPRLTSVEAPLVLEYLAVVGALVSQTVHAAERHPSTHPHLVHSTAIATAAGRAANEAAVSNESSFVQGSQVVDTDRIDRTYEMMGLSGTPPQAALTQGQAGQQASMPYRTPDSLEGLVGQDEVAAARAMVEQSYARAANEDSIHV